MTGGGDPAEDRKDRGSNTSGRSVSVDQEEIPPGWQMMSSSALIGKK